MLREAEQFYDELSENYHLLYSDWNISIDQQGRILEKILLHNRGPVVKTVLDCDCGIGTQALGLAARGYQVTASDISSAAVQRARAEAEKRGLDIRFEIADLRFLEEKIQDQFDAVISLDNALAHLMEERELRRALKSIYGRLEHNGLFVASILDYDAILLNKPRVTPTEIHEFSDGRRITFQVWDWQGEERYDLTQYIIVEQNGEAEVYLSRCGYRPIRRYEMSILLEETGFHGVRWLFPDETGFYQPIVLARR